MGQTKIQKELAAAKKQIAMLQVHIVKMLEQKTIIDSHNALWNDYRSLEKRFKKYKIRNK